MASRKLYRPDLKPHILIMPSDRTAHSPSSCHNGRAVIDWARSPTPVGYLEAVDLMEARAAAIRLAQAPELIWLVEHPPLYTAGSSARAEDLVAPDRFPVYPTRRGGQYTYHGPGQRVVYVMLDVAARGRDVRAFVAALEIAIIGAIDRLGIAGETRSDRVGVWVRRQSTLDCLEREDKIAAIGIRLKSWVSLHGLSVNVSPDLGHFDGIVPCGVTGHGVTSVADLGIAADMEAVDNALRGSFESVFGLTRTAPCPLIEAESGPAR